MAETTTHRPKRPRDDFQSPQDSIFSDDSKRHKPYNNILNLLEEEDLDLDPTLEPPIHDLTAIFTTLQQELSSSSSSSSSSSTPTSTAEAAAAVDPPSAAVDNPASEEDESVKSVMRHLLEASDDELGIPNRREDDDNNDNNNNITDSFEIFKSGGEVQCDFGDNGGLWEIEDEAANYYSVLQAEFFM